MSKMSLSRAFTTRRAKQSQAQSQSQSAPPMPQPQRSLTTKQFAVGEIKRKNISSPIELISTTNMLSYNAPDIYPKNISAQSSVGDLDSVPQLTSSPTTSADSSSVDSVPDSPEPNHSVMFFGASGRQSPSSSDGVHAPMIPQRALSHTKKTHEMLSRKRSQSRVSNLSSRPSVRSVARDSAQMFNPAIAEDDTPESHPFGNELAQVTELAEEFGIQTMAMIDSEEQELASRGLLKFSAEDYISEIQSCFAAVFGDPAPVRTMVWI